MMMTFDDFMTPVSSNEKASSIFAKAFRSGQNDQILFDLGWSSIPFCFRFLLDLLESFR